ncbi:MAG: DUF4919 domain-containing protein [Fluviicola sp.]|nr:DUF4919 domain-containing protein [Fluviicola sp.]
MTDDFFKFLSETTKENFLAVQQIVYSDESYNPYSEDLNILEEQLDNDEFEEVVKYVSVNILLSPRAHFYKNYAYTKLGNEDGANAELILGQKILEAISLTGNGTIEMPYRITRMSDERDLLAYMDETFASQSLVAENNRFYDLITTQSGNRIYFDISTSYTKMQNLVDDGEMDLSFLTEETVNEKKWWQFWK